MTKKISDSYEVLVIFAGTLRENEFKKELEQFEAELAKDVKILNKLTWPARPLAYKIAGNTTGNYFVAHFEAPGKVIGKLDNALRLDPKILRHLITKTPKNYVWREYSEEDLEHDFTKLDKPEPAAEPRYAKKKVVGKKQLEQKAAKVEKAAAPEADAGAIDKKLDDILADL
ncbi:MAG: 30S ribosomal protein S6 [Patescibacteria group bacterium]